MENILIAIDATDIHMPTIDFACYLGRLTHSKVTGIFLENLVADEKVFLKSWQGTTYPDWDIDENASYIIEKREKIEANIQLFRNACEKRSVRCSVHRDEGVPGKEMIAESRYADLVVTNAATSFKKIAEGVPTRFVRNLLKNAECPIIIAPETFEEIDRIVFAYDGTRSSAFAMRQFTYLFPQLNDKKVTVFRVDENRSWTIDEEKRINGWLQNHYSAIGFETVAGEASYELLAYLLHKKNIFIVMGAYGRSILSTFFKHSHADILVKIISQPIFIAHC